MKSLKDALFPVEGWEMPKFFSMSFMMFMIIYIYTTVRDTKDTLVVSACGAESITFLKVLPILLPHLSCMNLRSCSQYQNLHHPRR